MKLHIRILFITLLLFALAVTVSAEESVKYIFQIDSDCTETVQSILRNAEPLAEDAGVYRTEDASLLRRLDNAGVLEDSCRDGTVYLDDFAEDIAYYDYYSVRTVAAVTGCAYAANHNITGAGVRIAVIDSGLMANYQQYTDGVIENGENFTVSETSESRFVTTDTYSHGTAAASIIVDRQFGVAPGATIVPLKCFASKSSSWSYVIEAIYAAVDDYNCDIINLSLGSTGSNSQMKAAVEYAQSKGVIVVAAAGNLSSNTTGNDGSYYPAGYDGVIGVGMTYLNKEIHLRSRHGSVVDLAAPGASIPVRLYSTGKIGTKSGTSFATPVVVGAVALALSVKPELTQDEIITLLHETAEDVGTAGFDYAYGYGFLNIGLFLAAVREDNTSAVFSRCDGSYYLSAYRADSALKTVLLAIYDEDKKLDDVTSYDIENARWLGCNLPIDSERYSFKFIFVNADYVPITMHIAYQREA